MGVLGSVCVVLTAVLAGCYAPSPVTGAPCGPGLECPSGQSCDVLAAGGPICSIPHQGGVTDASDDAPDGEPGDPDASPPGDGSTTLIGPANDTPANAIDVSAGGVFTWDPTNATDDFASPCAASAGPDVFFRITLAAPEVVYLDTFGSSANAVIAVRAGNCSPVGAAEACVDNSCGGTQAQGAWNLAAGPHCIVVDQVGAAGGTAGKLTVARGGRAGDPLIGAAGSVTGNTCTDNNSNNASCGCEPAEDHHYFVPVCPGTKSLHIETCMGATWDTVLQIRNNASSSIACTDDSCSEFQSTLTRDLVGPGLFWAIIDGCDECGAYTMAFTLN